MKTTLEILDEIEKRGGYVPSVAQKDISALTAALRVCIKGFESCLETCEAMLYSSENRGTQRFGIAEILRHKETLQKIEQILKGGI